MSLTIAYRGNFQPDLPEGVESWSTETHVAKSLELLGHEVIRIQENQSGWEETRSLAHSADMFLWTSTFGYAENWPREEAITTLERLDEKMVTAGIHLDLWHGLKRAADHGLVGEQPVSPFFRCHWVFTADGDHQDEFAAKGVNHHWLPPAVYSEECHPGTYRPELQADVAFLGNWRGGYHDEWWPKRHALIRFLQRGYRNGLKFYPQPGHGAVRGWALNDVLASTKVVVGDSCFVDRSRTYVSDRPFEQVGRGAFVLFPAHEALSQMLLDGEHIRYFPHGNFDVLKSQIDYFLSSGEGEEERERIRHAGQVHVRENHTYKHRLQKLLEVVGLA